MTMLNFFLGAILIIGIFTRIDMMAQKISPHDLGKSFKLIETFDLLDEELSQTTFTETNKLFITTKNRKTNQWIYRLGDMKREISPCNNSSNKEKFSLGGAISDENLFVNFCPDFSFEVWNLNTAKKLLSFQAKKDKLLEDGFFHADPHPGNLLVMPDGRLAFFDFGMVGRITPQLQSKMIDAFFHVVAKDPAGIAQDLIDLDFMKPGSNADAVRPVVEKMFEFHLNLKLKDVNFKELTYDLADVMYDYPFRLPSNFTYIMRALMTLEGIGIITDPEFNFFETAKPYAKEFMFKREGKDLRKLLTDKLLGRDTEDGKIDLDRTWKLAKMAAKTIWNSRK